MRGGIERRLTESVDMALNLADDIVVINTFDGGDRLFSRRLACVDCGLSMPEMTPRAFSFNSPHGACPDCQGLGAIVDFDPARVVPDEIEVAGRRRDRAVGARRRKLVREALQALSRDFGIDLDVPFGRLPRSSANVLLFGAAAATGRFEGLMPEPAPALRGGQLGRAGGARAVPRAARRARLPRRAPEARRAWRSGSRGGRSPTT